mgnify:CR=1 FL=1
MENTKIIKRLIQHYIEGSELTQDEHFEVRSLEKQLAAINYTRCCTELKDKETISFEEWLFVNNYKKLFDYFVKDAVSFTESELMQIYNDQVMSL